MHRTGLPTNPPPPTQIWLKMLIVPQLRSPGLNWAVNSSSLLSRRDTTIGNLQGKKNFVCNCENLHILTVQKSSCLCQWICVFFKEKEDFWFWGVRGNLLGHLIFGNSLLLLQIKRLCVVCYLILIELLIVTWSFAILGTFPTFCR